MNHLFRRFLLVALISYVLILTTMGVVLAEFGLHPPHLAPIPTTPPEGWQGARIQARDGVPLDAWVYAPDSAREAVLLLHGVAATRDQMHRLGGMFARNGYAVLIPDMRAHGSSGGPLCTYGALEVDDMTRWVDWIESRVHPTCVFGLGESMGGAILIQTLPQEPRLCAAVAESPFSTFREIGYDRIGQRLPLLAGVPRPFVWPALATGFLYARLRYGVDFDSVSPERAAAQSTTPLFLIHGGDDTNIVVRHSRRIVAARHGQVPLWMVPGARHTGAYGTAPQEFERRVVGFFRAHSK